MFANVFSLAIPLSFMAVIDRVLVSSSYSTLNIILVLLFSFCIAEGILKTISTYILNWCSISIISEVSGTFFYKAISLHNNFYKKQSPGDFISRIDEIDVIRNYISNWILSYSVDVFFMVIFLFVMMSINVELTLTILLTIPLYIFQTQVFSSKIKSKNKDVFERRVEFNSSVLEFYNGIEIVKLCARDSFFLRRIFFSLAESLRSSFSLLNTLLYSEQLSILLSKFIDSIVLFLGAYLVLEQRLTLGELVAFNLNLLKDRVTMPLLKISRIIEELNQYKLSKSRVDFVMKQDVDVNNGHINLDFNIKDIEFKNVNLSIDSSHILTDISFCAKAGSLTCIVGESGAGKSSITKLIARFIDIDSGSIEFSGININNIDLTSLRESIAYVSQDNFFFIGTIRDNLLLMSDSKDECWMKECARLAGLDKFIESLPDKYETMLNNNADRFSGGQKQRLSIARAIASNRPIIIFDEATSALDTFSENYIIKTFKKLKNEKILIVITHRLSIAKNADYIIYLHDGHLVESGQHQKLYFAGGGYYHAYNEQMNGNIFDEVK